VKQIAAVAVALSAIFLTSSIIPLANADMFSMFCSAVRASVATGPQASSCGLLGQAQQLQQNQQSATGLNQNPCPQNYVLSGVQCVPINGASNSASTPGTTVLSLPIANAGPAQQVTASSDVVLNGAASTPGSTVLTPPGTVIQNTITSYGWSQVSGQSVALQGATTVNPSFQAPNTNTTLVFSLQIQDSGGLVSSQPSTVTITVK
jgi:hypothetical protein